MASPSLEEVGGQPGGDAIRRFLAVSFNDDGTLTGGHSSDRLGLTPTPVKTGSYNAVAGDFVPVNTTGGSLTVTLPNAPADGSVVCVKLVLPAVIVASATVACAGSDVFNKAGGATTATLSLLSQALLVQYKASTGIWYVVADDLPLSQLDLRYPVATIDTDGTLAANSDTRVASQKAAKTYVDGRTAFVFNVKAYGAVGDGTTDDTTAIQAAITAAAAVGGTVYFPEAAYKITTALNITGSVTLRGAGMRQYMFLSSLSARGSRITWAGSAGGTMVNVCPVVGASAPVSGVVIEDLAISGAAASPSTGAAIGIRLAAATQCVIRDVFVSECTTATIKTDGNTDGTYTGLNYVYSCSFENIWLYNNLSGGDGLYLSGLGSGSGTDTAFCSFRHFHITYKGGNGITVNDADDNAFYMIGMSQIAGFTGNGVRLKATAVNGKGARNNTFFFVWPGLGGVYAEGTASNTYASHSNSIYGYSDVDSVPAPIIEAGASLLVEYQSGDRYVYGGSDNSIADGTSVAHSFNAYGASGVQALYGRRSRGSLASPLRTKNGDSFLSILGFGFHAADDVSAATLDATAATRIRLASREDHTATAQGGYIAFDTIAVGATSLVERMQITGVGLDLEGTSKVFNSAAATTAGDLVRYEQALLSGAVTAADGSVVVGGTGVAPTVRTGTLDTIATQHPPTASVAMNSQKITGLANGTAGTDAANVSQIGNPLASALGYVAWSWDPRINQSAGSLTSQGIFGQAVWLASGTVVTGVALAIQQAGAGTVPTGFYVGLADSTQKILVKSNNLNGSSSLTTLGVQQFAFSATYTIGTSGLYYLVILENGAFASTVAQFELVSGTQGGVTGVALGANPRSAGVQSGQATLPAVNSSLAFTGSPNALYWMGAY